MVYVNCLLQTQLNSLEASQMECEIQKPTQVQLYAS